MLCYSHSSYFGEIPEQYLKNERGEYIDKKGNVVDQYNRFDNYYFNDFKEKWNPMGYKSNPSLPILVKPEEK